MTNRETMELFIEKNGQETVAYPFVEKDHVVFGNGMGIEEVIEQDISMPTVTHEEVSFKVGVGDQNVSSSVVDSSVGEMVIKGQTYHNILPEPSTHGLTNNKEMFKVNEGLDPNVEIVDGVSKSAILKGQTLVNLQEIANSWTLNANGENASYKADLPTALLKPSTKYLVKFNKDISTFCNRFYFVQANSIINSLESHPTGAYGIIETSSSLTSSTTAIHIYPIDGNLITSDQLVDLHVMIIEYQEGMENWNISYFEGMQSVKMPVLKTCGKNLCDNSKNKPIEIDYTTGAEYANSNNVIVSDYIEINPLKTYIASKVTSLELGSITFRYYNNKKEYIGTSKTNEAKYVRIRQTNQNGKLNLNDILFQFEEGSTATTYEPHKSNTLSTPEDLELRGIGDVKDTLDCLTGEVTERIGEIVLNGSENWVRYDGYGVDGYSAFITTIPSLNNLYGDNIASFISADFPTGTWNDYKGAVIDELVWNHDPNRIGIKVKSERASNAEEIKSFLSTNNIRINYKLTTPVIKTVDLSSSGNWEKIVLDGSEDEVWHNGDPSWANKIFRLDGARHTPNIMNSANALVKTGLLFSSHFEEKEMNNLCNLKPQPEGVSIYGDSIFVGSPLTSTIGELRTWLSQNPITVWYQTATHQDSTQVKQPIFFKDGHIQLSSGADNSLIPTLDYQAKTSNSYVMDLMKTNTKYTMKAKSANGTFTIDGTSYGAGTNGTFTTPISTTNKLLVMSSKTNEEVMILEGDVTDKTIPYFKGIKSAFEDESKIEVLSTGKNLFDGVFEKGMIDVNGIPGYSSTAIRTVNYINVKSNTSYHINLLNLEPFESFRVVYVHEYDENFKVLGETEVGNRNTYTSKSATKFIKINTHTAHDLPVDSKMIVCENSTLDKQYEPYKSNSTKIPLLSPLRSLPNGVCDELIIDRMKKKATLIQRVGHSVINSEFAKNGGKWGNTKDTNPCWGFHCGNYVQGSFKLNEHNSINDKLPIKPMATTGDPLMGYYQSNPHIALRREEVCDIKMALNWLDRNPINFYYQLETPVITEVDLEGFPYVYKDGHIFLNSEIAPNTQITYSISQQHQISASTQDLIRHEQELVYLYKLIAQYIQVDYQSTLLSLDLKLK